MTKTTLSLALLAIALAFLLLLAVEVAHDLACAHARLRTDARSPDSFTVVAATAVVATRLTLAGWGVSAEVLLGVAAPPG